MINNLKIKSDKENKYFYGLFLKLLNESSVKLVNVQLE